MGRWFGSPVSARSSLKPGVSGEPLRAWKMKPTCQSWVITRTMPLPIPGLSSTELRLNRCRRSLLHGPVAGP